MTADSILYLSREDVEATRLPMSEIIDALDAMFREKGNGKVEMPPKPGIHTRPDCNTVGMVACGVQRRRPAGSGQAGNR